LYATSVASSITRAATYDTGRGAGSSGWVEDTTVHERPWARDIIRDAAALAAAPDHPATLQIGRSRTAGIVAVVLHADVWSLLIRTGRNSVGHVVPLWSLAYSDAPTDFNPTMMPDDIAWCFDNDCSVDGVDWSDMIRAVLTAIT
jgi:hypothetical protein